MLLLNDIWVNNDSYSIEEGCDNALEVHLSVERHQMFIVLDLNLKEFMAEPEVS